MRHVKDALVETYEMIETAYRNQGGLTGIATGFTDLDQMLSGLHADELILVAARPSMGKTSFVMNIVQDLSLIHILHPAADRLLLHRLGRQRLYPPGGQTQEHGQVRAGHLPQRGGQQHLHQRLQ